AARWRRWLAAMPRVRVGVVDLLAPSVAFAVVFLLFTPGVLLTPKEFANGVAQVLFAQVGHRRALPATISFVYLARSLGPLALVLAAGGAVWAMARLRRWDGSPAANGVVLYLGWAAVYGALVLFAFARVPSYVD